jgi:hypothetical protein
MKRSWNKFWSIKLLLALASTVVLDFGSQFLFSTLLRILKWGLFFNEKKGLTTTACLLHWCWPSPAQWFFVEAHGLITIFYCLSAIAAFRPLSSLRITNRLLSIHFILRIWYDTDHIQNIASNNSSIIACVFIAAGTSLPSRLHATAASYQSQSYVTIDGSVGQSVLEYNTHLGLNTRSLLLSDSCWCGALSLTRGRVCRLPDSVSSNTTLVSMYNLHVTSY